ncbi:MAG TPA: protein kinase [Pyrinomonadaceae bacterium]|jgi:serine/threonine-protein kinase|nr:protein kinase [Pyrinomonadaceae bacterium]
MKYCPVCNAKYEDETSFCATDGEVLENDPTSIVDSVLDGQYHVEQMLGKGGMGAVYRARHILLGDRVAIKVLPPQMRNNAEWLRRFRREGQAARRFRHPNAVTVYDLRTTADGLIYMVMEYVEGHTLDAELKARKRFTPAEAFAALEPVMSVLNAAHAQGVVHRDLKPENIMLGKPTDGGQPQVKLLDLGIAKISEVAGSEASGTTALTVAGQVLGTPYYMSPEQWGEVPDDGGTEVDGRADIYSLGAVFYELIAGRKPFMGRTLQELRREHVSVMPQPLHEFMPDVPERFSRSIARAMSKDRSGRQATAGEVASELYAALAEAGLMPALGASGVGQQPQATGSSTTPTGISQGGGSGQPPPFATDIAEARNTGADINPTILTIDAPPLRPDAGAQSSSAPSVHTQPPSAARPPAPPVGQQGSAPAPHTRQNAPPMPTIATNPSALNASSAPVQPVSYAQTPSYNQTPSYAPSGPGAAAKGRSPVIPIIAGVLGLLLLVGVGGGLLLWSRMSEEKPVTGTETKTNVPSGTGKETSEPNVATETMRYWLEVASAEGGQGTRVAGVVPLASGQKFKFHLTPREDGYLYIVGPGDRNVPTTFLTAKPIEVSGVDTNEVSANGDFAFPDGADNWIQLDKTAGTEYWTIIFSPTPLASPAFLNDEAGSALSEEEQSEFEQFRDQHKANAPSTDVSNGADPMVSVKVPPAKAKGEPVVFDIRIEHK